MTKIIIFILFILPSCLLTSCDNKKHPTLLKLSIDSLTYSAYRWRIDKDSKGWELFIAYYICIHKDGKYLAMRHNTTAEPAEYFSGNIDTSMIRLIGNFSSKKWDSAYYNPEPIIYNGNTCDLTFISDKQQKHILLIQGYSPAPLQDILAELDSVIFKSRNHAVPFNFEAYKKNLEKRSLAIIGELPTLKQPNIRKKNNR